MRAIAMLFFAISKLGDTAKHLRIHQQFHYCHHISSRSARYSICKGDRENNFDFRSHRFLRTSTGDLNVPLVACNGWMKITSMFVDDTHIAVCFCIHWPMLSCIFVTFESHVILHHFWVDNSQIVIGWLRRQKCQSINKDRQAASFKIFVWSNIHRMK